jgi:hypothetical protein
MEKVAGTFMGAAAHLNPGFRPNTPGAGPARFAPTATARAQAALNPTTAAKKPMSGLGKLLLGGGLAAGGAALLSGGPHHDPTDNLVYSPMNTGGMY